MINIKKSQDQDPFRKFAKRTQRMSVNTDRTMLSIRRKKWNNFMKLIFYPI